MALLALKKGAPKIADRIYAAIAPWMEEKKEDTVGICRSLYNKRRQLSLKKNVPLFIHGDTIILFPKTLANGSSPFHKRG